MNFMEQGAVPLKLTYLTVTTDSSSLLLLAP